MTGPEFDDLPWDREFEIKNDILEKDYSRIINKGERFTALKEMSEERDMIAAELAAHAEPQLPIVDDSNEPELTVFESRTLGPPLRPTVEGNNSFIADLKKSYHDDPLFKHILSTIESHPCFSKVDDLLFCKNKGDEDVLCIPEGVHSDTNKSLRGIVIESAHSVVGHVGQQKTAEYIHHWYWWPSIHRDVLQFCQSCKRCQESKSLTIRPYGLLHRLPIPSRPWDSIGMDFVGPFPEIDGFNYLWVVICHLTSMVHLIPINTTTKATKLSWMFLKEVVRLHGLPSSIVSDRDSTFTSRWWREAHRLLGVRLLMSIAFHPQTDGVTEHIIQSATQVLRATVRADQKDWIFRLPMTEFAINSSINVSTGYAPFFLNGGQVPSMIRDLGKLGAGVPGVAEFAKKALIHLMDAHDSIIEAREFQTVYANRHRTKEPLIREGDLVYLSTKNLCISLGRA